MSLDKFASADGKTPNTPHVPPAPQETEEDLFDFDELSGASAKAAAEMKKELDEALTHVESAAVDVSKAVAAAPVKPAPRVDPFLAPLAQVAAEIRPAPAAGATASTVSTTSQILHKFQATPALIGMLAAVVTINLALVVVAWSSIRSVENTILDLGHEVVDTTRSLRQGTIGEVAARETPDTAVFGALPEGYRTLELARQRIDRGEFARARRTLFGLLSIIDRIEPPARADVEARAQILIADSYRIEATKIAGAANAAPDAAHMEAHR